MKIKTITFRLPENQWLDYCKMLSSRNLVPDFVSDNRKCQMGIAYASKMIESQHPDRKGKKGWI